MSTLVEVTKEKDGPSLEGDVARVRARLADLIQKKDKEMLRRVQERKLSSALPGDRKHVFGTTVRRMVRPASSEPTMATLPE